MKKHRNNTLEIRRVITTTLLAKPPWLPRRNCHLLHNHQDGGFLPLATINSSLLCLNKTSFVCPHPCQPHPHHGFLSLFSFHPPPSCLPHHHGEATMSLLILIILPLVRTTTCHSPSSSLAHSPSHPFLSLSLSRFSPFSPKLPPHNPPI
ncbi:hypothetical protein VNO77_03990 [Canavalia gladiata]|uniref:Uncharacterized protein n=1 Tax=Canavalia gladiata TaxID=3824 RepID=A0AAN9N1F5_CANGL